MTIVRTFISIAAIRKWHIYLLDVKNAFLSGSLVEEIYMHLPLGPVQPPHYV